MTDQPTTLLDEVLRDLDRSRGRWAEVSDGSGVPYHTLTKIAQGQNKNPRVQTVQKLHDHFRRCSIKASANDSDAKSEAA